MVGAVVVGLYCIVFDTGEREREWEGIAKASNEFSHVRMWRGGYFEF